MNIWHDISDSRINPQDFVAVIEIPKDCKVKYEMDKRTGMLRMDRVLHTSTHYPANYGFIPRTYAGDRDPLDVLVLCSVSVYPMTLMRCYPIGTIKMIDNNEEDEKVIAIPFGDPNYNCYKSIDDLPKHIFEEMMHFFEVYKALENKDTAVKEIVGPEETIEIISSAIKHYKEHFNIEV